MKGLSKILAIAGVVLVLYAIFSYFYGETGIAMTRFRSANVLLGANTLLILSLVLKDMGK